MAAISLPSFNLICVTYLGGSAPVVADVTFFFFFWQLVDIFDWKLKIFTANVKKRILYTILIFQPKISNSDQKTRKQSTLGDEQRLNPLGKSRQIKLNDDREIGRHVFQSRSARLHPQRHGGITWESKTKLIFLSFLTLNLFWLRLCDSWHSDSVRWFVADETWPKIYQVALYSSCYSANSLKLFYRLSHLLLLLFQKQKRLPKSLRGVLSCKEIKSLTKKKTFSRLHPIVYLWSLRVFVWILNIVERLVFLYPLLTFPCTFRDQNCRIVFLRLNFLSHLLFFFRFLRMTFHSNQTQRKSRK